MTKMGVFQGEVDGSICPKANCSVISLVTASNFSEVSGHWGTHTGVSVFHGIGRAAPVAPRKNPGPVFLGWGWALPALSVLVLGDPAHFLLRTPSFSSYR